MEQWQIEMNKAKEKKELQKKYPLLGRKVRRKGRSKWEEGIIVLEKSFNSNDKELFIKFSNDELEQLNGLPFQIWNEKENSWNDNN